MDVDIRKGMPNPHIDKEEFRQRFFAQFYDPAFAAIGEELERAFEIAWQAYEESRKAPRTRAAGEKFDDGDFQLSEEWLAAHQAIMDAEVAHDDPSLPAKILIINASPRSQHTCPGEMSKTYRLVEVARETAGRYFPAKRASRHHRRFVIGPALAISTTHWDRRLIG